MIDLGLNESFSTSPNSREQVMRITIVVNTTVSPKQSYFSSPVELREFSAALSMASTFVTVVKPFTSHSTNFHRFPAKIPNSTFTRKNSLRVNAIAKKFEPAKVVPQADRVLIRLEELPEKSAGGVLLPKSAVKFERYLMGEVISVGAEAGELNSGKKVIFSDMNAYEVDLGTEARHCFCKAGDLLATVE